jgi:hypothetical protein
MQHGHDAHHGTVLVEGKQASAFTVADGQQGKGHDVLHGQGWHWRQHPWEVGVRYVRLRAPRPPDGPVTVVIVEEPDPDRFYL